MEISECKTKGTGLRSTQLFFDKKFGPAYFEKYWSKYYPDYPSEININIWYPLEPNIRWHCDSAKDANESLQEYFIEFSNFVVNNDLNGVYRFFIELGGIQKVLGVTPQLISAYLNCVKVKIHVNLDEYYMAEMTCPIFAKEWQIYGHKGAYKAILQIFGFNLLSFSIISEEDIIVDNLESCKIIYEIKYR